MEQARGAAVFHGAGRRGLPGGRAGWAGRVRRCLTVSVALCVCSAWAGAQQAAEPVPTGAVSGQQPVALEQLPALVRLGLKAGVTDRIPVAPTLVIVEDDSSYALAIGSWSVKGRFPILYDDGTVASAQRIARFVRAFAPKNILHLAPDPQRPIWPKDEPTRQLAMRAALASAWRDSDQPIRADDLKAQWDKLQFKPVGVVAADVNDPTWTAALALAAGHGQPLIFPEFPLVGRNDPNLRMPYEQARALAQSIEGKTGETGYEFRALGDQIDAVTVCFNGSVKFAPPGTPPTEPNLSAGMTDLVGRNFENADAPGQTRWAWSGQIIGNSSEATYAAMCSLFLPTASAWLFDGYGPEEAFASHKLAKGAELLGKSGFEVWFDDAGRQGLADWRRRILGLPALEPGQGAPAANGSGGGVGGAAVERGLNRSLVMVNTSGNMDFFDLKPGQGRTGDVPFLRTPPAVYFVHSWSATAPANRDTLAGRWLERGAFAYCGSVHEPYLQGFVPPTVVAARLLAGAPWGAAVRFENAGLWKIVTLGDPLWRVRRSIDRTDSPAAVTHTRPLSEELGEHLKARDFEKALRALSMLGRDADVVKLATAMLDDAQKPMTPAAAVQALPSVFFLGDSETFRRVFTEALPAIKSDASLAGMLDMPWQVYEPVISTLRRPEAELLVRCVRSGAQRESDAQKAAEAMKNAR